MERTLLGELGQLADDVDLLLAFVRLEELDLALEHRVLLDVETRALRDALVVLINGREWNASSNPR